MVTSEDTQDTTTGSEDTHVTVVEPEDYVDILEQQTFDVPMKREEREGRRMNNHVRLQPRVF